MGFGQKPTRSVLGFHQDTAPLSINGLHTPRKLPHRLVVERALFEKTLGELERRSGSWRESGALWSGRVSGADWIAEQVHFHHELCDDGATALSMELTEVAKFALYEMLALQERRLVALIHTHPQDWVELSSIDRRNQVSSRIGFWSLVVPNYGQKPWLVEDMGIHTREHDGWYQLAPSQARLHLEIR